MKIIRGDTKCFKFQRTSNGEPIETKAEKIYFSVKNTSKNNDVIFQKTIEDMTFDENFFYHFIIYPEDTNNLQYGDYVYDIEVKIGSNYVKTISRGPFIIDYEVTFAGNEV